MTHPEVVQLIVKAILKYGPVKWQQMEPLVVELVRDTRELNTSGELGTHDYFWACCDIVSEMVGLEASKT